MLKAVKGNKTYTISEVEKKDYLSQGFDVYDGDKVVQYADTKVIKYNDHVEIVEKLKTENETLKAEIEALKAEKESATKKK